MFVKDKDELEHISTLGSLYTAMATYLVLSAAQIANVARSKTFPIREIGYDSVLLDSNFLI